MLMTTGASLPKYYNLLKQNSHQMAISLCSFLNISPAFFFLSIAAMKYYSDMALQHMHYLIPE